MPLRLSELLERIRPSGTPGAPSEGQQQRIDADRAEELAELAEVLQRYEEEADALVAAANERASGRIQAAEREARQIRSGLADQVAAVQAAATRDELGRDPEDEGSVAADTAAEVARLEARASGLIPELSDAAIEVIWSMVPSKAGPVEGS